MNKKLTLILLSIITFLPLAAQENQDLVIGSDSIFQINSMISGEQTLIIREHPKLKEHVILVTINNGVMMQEQSMLVKAKQVSFSNWDNLLFKNKIVEDGITRFYENGCLVKDVLFEKKLYKEVTQYYNNGAKLHWYQVTSDRYGLYKKSGDYKEWDEDEILVVTGSYRNNYKHGEFSVYNLDGSISYTSTYKNGKLNKGKPVFNVRAINASVTKHPVFNEPYSSELKRELAQRFNESLEIQLVIDDKGGIKNIETEDEQFRQTIRQIFTGQPYLHPAQIEGVSVAYEGLLCVVIDKADISLEWKDLAADVLFAIDEAPQFPGKEEGLRRYIATSVKYPVNAQTSGQQGSPYISFVVDTKGMISDIKVARSSGYILLDKEAMRVVQDMPRWTPGRHEGKLVKVSYTIPVHFVLK